MSGAADWVRNAVARLSSEIGAQDARREARMIVQQASGWSAARVAVAGAAGSAEQQRIKK